MNNSIDFQINIGGNASVSPCIKKDLIQMINAWFNSSEETRKIGRKKFGSYLIYINFV